jgi:hypothetical protein
MTLQNKLLNNPRRSAKSLLVSVLFSSLTLYPAVDLAAQQIRMVTAISVDQIAVAGTLMAKDEIRIAFR